MADLDLAPNSNIERRGPLMYSTAVDGRLILIGLPGWTDEEFDRAVTACAADSVPIDQWDYTVTDDGVEIWVITLEREDAHA